MTTIIKIRLPIWIITLLLFGCLENKTEEVRKDSSTIYIPKSATSVKNQNIERVDEYTKEPPYIDTVLNEYINSFGLKDYLISTSHEPYQINGYFNSDENIDTAIIIWNKKNRKDGLLIKYGNSSDFEILGAGNEVLYRGFDDFNWVGEFHKINKGEKVASNLDENDEFITEEIPDSLKTTLKTDGIYVHASESCGGGIIYWDNDKYNWIQQE